MSRPKNLTQVNNWRLTFITNPITDKKELKHRRGRVKTYLDIYLQGISWLASNMDNDFEHTYTIKKPPKWTEVNNKKHSLVCDIIEQRLLKPNGNPGGGGGGVVPPPPNPKPPM